MIDPPNGDELLGQLREAVAAVDRELRVTYANDAFARMFTLSAADTIGLRVPDLADCDLAHLQHAVGRVLDTGACGSVPMSTPGPAGPREFRVDLYPGPSGTDRVWLVSHDVTREHALRTERDHALVFERTARAALDRIHSVRDEMLGTISHEIRTPVTVVIGWAEYLKTVEDPAQLAAGLAAVERSAREYLDTLDNLIDMSRAATGLLELSVAPVHADDLLRQVVADVTERVDLGPVQVTLEGDVGGDATLLVDRRSIERALSAVVYNAVTFAASHVSLSRAVESAGKSLRILVADDGPGIDPLFLPHAFEPFRQQDSSASRGHGGLGLGLAVAKAFIEAHGGTIEARDRGDASGTVIAVSLPLQAAHVV